MDVLEKFVPQMSVDPEMRSLERHMNNELDTAVDRITRDLQESKKDHEVAKKIEKALIEQSAQKLK